MAAPCFSTRSATCRWTRRRSCCACCRRASTRRSAAPRCAGRRAHHRRHQPGPAARCPQRQFREDLFFRLNVVPIAVPPLRERTEDIPDLVRHFFTQVEREGLPPGSTRPLTRMRRHRWPGNVRELENLARRLAALYPQETISAAVVEAELSQPALVSPSESHRGEDNLLERGRTLSGALLLRLRRGPAAAGPLSSDLARSGRTASLCRAGGDPWQPVPAPPTSSA